LSNDFNNISDQNKAELIIVDLDFSLVKVNTTFDFLKTLHPIKYRIFSDLLRFLNVLNRLYKGDLYKKMLVLLCMLGMPKKKIEYYSNIYKNSMEKKNRYNRKILDFLSRTRTKKVLLSASLDVLVKKFKELGFDIAIGSKTYYKYGRFFMFTDLYGKKHDIVKQFLKSFNSIIIIDDSPEPELTRISYNGKKIYILNPDDIR
jgi:hypothetical protein